MPVTWAKLAVAGALAAAVASSSSSALLIDGAFDSVHAKGKSEQCSSSL